MGSDGRGQRARERERARSREVNRRKQTVKLVLADMS